MKIVSMPEYERHPATHAETLTSLLDIDIEEWRIFLKIGFKKIGKLYSYIQ